MSVTTLNWKEALKCVRVVRTIANPNLGFQRQLQEFEGRRLREVIENRADKIFVLDLFLIQRNIDLIAILSYLCLSSHVNRKEKG